MWHNFISLYTWKVINHGLQNLSHFITFFSGNSIMGPFTWYVLTVRTGLLPRTHCNPLNVRAKTTARRSSRNGRICMLQVTTNYERIHYLECFQIPCWCANILDTQLYVILNINCIIHTGNPSFWIILANFRVAIYESFSFLAPVQTILPDLKILINNTKVKIRLLKFFDYYLNKFFLQCLYVINILEN